MFRLVHFFGNINFLPDHEQTFHHLLKMASILNSRSTYVCMYVCMLCMYVCVYIYIVVQK